MKIRLFTVKDHARTPFLQVDRSFCRELIFTLIKYHKRILLLCFHGSRKWGNRLNGNNSFIASKGESMTKSLKAILTTSMLLIVLISAGCSDSSDSTSNVTITKKSMYYEVNIDYSSGNRYGIGREYGTKVLSMVPTYEAGGDAFVEASVSGLPPEITYEVLIQRALEISKNVKSQYMDEIEGFASVLSGGTVNELGDGKLSRDEFLMINFDPDIATDHGCSATAVFGSRSATGQTILGRNTDWAAIPGIPTGVVYSKTGEKQVVSFVLLGMVGVIVGINSDGIFVSNLYGDNMPATEFPYSAVGKRSVMLDIREALETLSTIDEVGAFLGDPSRLYAYHNHMFIADKNTAKVLENDYERNRALRVFDSELNPGVTWGISNAIACVNGFVLKGNYDSFTDYPVEYERWANFKTMLTQNGDTVDIDQIRTIMSYHKSGAGGMNDGDIYNRGTIQSMAYSYSENRLEFWLGNFEDDPQYETISIPFLEGQ